MINGDFLTTKDCSNLSILYGILNMQKFLQQVWSWNCLVNNKQASQTCLFYPLSLCGFHLDPLKHFLNLFCFNKCLLLNYFGKWIALLHLFLTLVPHHVLGLELGRYNKRYVKIINSTSKNPPSTGTNENFANFSTLIGYSTYFSFFITLLSTYFCSS